jgi:O-antigen ligase/tetratricopeptide (TPR) repeat protein
VLLPENASAVPDGVIVTSTIGRVAAAPASLTRGTAVAARVQAWLVPAAATLVPLVCSAALSDGFEIPKLELVKLGLAVAVLLVAARARVDVGVLRAPAAVAAVLFVTVASLATVTSIDPRTSVLGSYSAQRGLMTLAVEIAWFLLAASWVRTESAFVRVAWGFTLAGVLAGAYALVQVAGFDPLGFPMPVDDPRPSASFGYANSLGEFLALSLPLTAFLALRGVGLRRDLASWALLPQLVGLALSQTRTAWFAVILELLLVGPLVLCAYRPGLGRLGRCLALVPVVGTVAVLGIVVLAPIVVSASVAGGDRLLATCPEAYCLYRGRPLETRQALWRSATAMIAARPILGWGPDTFGLVYPGYRSVDLDVLDGSVGGDDIAHNVFLDTAVSAGLAGVAAAAAVHVAVLLVLLRAAFGGRERGDRKAIALALLLGWSTFAVLFTTGRMRVVTDWQAWIYAGLALGLFVKRPHWTWRLGTVARVVLAGVGLVLVADAFTAVVADSAAQAGQRSSPTRALGAREQAVALRPFEPAYQRDFGLALTAAGAETGDSNLQAAGVEHLATASALVGNHEPSLLLDLARAVEGAEDTAGQPTDAPLRYAAQAIGLDPSNPLPYADAAELAIIRHRPDLGAMYWEAARIRTRTPDALRRLGEVATELGETDSARIAFREATSREWRSVEKGMAAREWGEAAFAEGLPDEAAQAFGQALQFTPNDTAARIRRIEALVAAGQRPQALAELQLARQAAPLDSLLANLEARLQP